MSANQKKQLAAYNKAVFGSETGGPSGSGVGLTDLEDIEAGGKILDERRKNMTAEERAAQDAYGQTLTKEEQMLYIIAVSKEERGAELSAEEKNALKAGNSNGEEGVDSAFTFAMARSAAICATFLL